MLNWRAGGIYERLVPSAVRAVVAGTVVPHVPGTIGRYARRSFLAMSRRPEAMFLDNFAGMPLRVQRELLDSDRVTGDPYAPSLAYFSRVNGANGMLGRLLYTDVKTYLVELLMKQDQMSMSASIESRVPFLDHTLVEFAATAARAAEAARLDDQADPSRGDARHPARTHPHPPEDGLSGAVRAVDAGQLECGRARMSCSIAARASAA